MRPIRLLWLAFAIGSVPAVPAVAGDGDPPGAPTAPTDPVAEGLADLRSPFAAVREAAVARLVALGPAARAPVLAAFSAAPAGTREPFARVLAADGTKEALDALLAGLLGLEEPSDVVAVRRALVEHADRVAEGVRAWRGADGTVPPAIADLARILDRARIEKVFTSRKSRSGGTGYYRGQYDALLPWRKQALSLCLSIVEDVEPVEPGRAPLGRYRFVNRPDMLVEPYEIREMAANAVGELVRRGDDEEFRRIHRIYARFREAYDARRDEWPPPAEDDLMDSLLATLYRHRDDVPAGSGESREPPMDPPDAYDQQVERRALELRMVQSSLASAAGFLLRLGKYREAIDEYRSALRRDSVSVAVPHYNIACAYANWSLEPDTDPSVAANYRRRALDYLRSAVEHGYLDWPWMEQDRDLDPIRSEAGYDRLIASVKEQFWVPPEKR